SIVENRWVFIVWLRQQFQNGAATRVANRGKKLIHIRYPCLVVEVLFPTTEARDRGKKSLQYRSCPTIQEYLLINADSPIVEVFRREKIGFWTLYTLGQDDTIELPHLGIHFPVAEVYQNTSFEEE